MNLLAHLLIADREAVSLPATLLGDVVKGEIDGRFDPETELAIRLHRRVDSFTDAHEAFARSRRRVASERRRYAGVFIDVFYDHLLSRRWTRFCDEPRETFIARAYGEISATRHELPERMQRLVDFMLETDLLGSYHEVEGVARALDRLAGRVRRPERFRGAGDDLRREGDGFADDFERFFPELLEFARQEARRLRG